MRKLDNSGLSGDGVWLSDPHVPHANPIWARYHTRVGAFRVKAWVPSEDTLWLDVHNEIVYHAKAGILTDFASTPIGDGDGGVMRGAGRLHDLMAADTPVLLPSCDASILQLEELLLIKAKLNSPECWLTIEEVLGCGFFISSRKVSIWEAGSLYYRMLISGGFSTFRAWLQVTFLRTFKAQHFFRWLTRGESLVFESNRLTD